jgi:hypothetical protein
MVPVQPMPLNYNSNQQNFQTIQIERDIDLAQPVALNVLEPLPPSYNSVMRQANLAKD